MFFGQPVNVARYDQQKYAIFEKLIEKQLSFFWRPEEVDISQDRLDYQGLPEHEKHIFISNLKYQTLLDSIQAAAPTSPSCRWCRCPSWRPDRDLGVLGDDPLALVHAHHPQHRPRSSVIFDDIVSNENIRLRAADIASYYDDLIGPSMLYAQLGVGEHVINGKTHRISEYELKKKTYLCLMSVNILEAIRFTSASPARSLRGAQADGRQRQDHPPDRPRRGAAPDRHAAPAEHHALGPDDPDFAKIARETEQECFEMFKRAATQEKLWAEYLFRDGSMIGLNKDILSQYVEYITNLRMTAVGWRRPSPGQAQPDPVDQHRLSSDTVQVAPQEVELSSYRRPDRRPGIARRPERHRAVTTVSTSDATFRLQEGETLLEGLERTGHDVEYQCRSGYCGTCRLKLEAGKVSYTTAPLAFVAPGEVLPCCCRPDGPVAVACWLRQADEALSEP